MKGTLLLLLCAVLVLSQVVVNAENLRGSIDTVEDVQVESIITSVSRRLQAKFNRFRSYANERNKPPMYSKTSRHHAVSEYLSPTQKYMVSHQRRDTPDVMFKAGWSGFDKDQ